MGEARASRLERIAPAAINRVRNSRRFIESNQCFPTSATAEVRSGFVPFFAPARYYTMFHTRTLRPPQGPARTGHHRAGPRPTPILLARASPRHRFPRRLLALDASGFSRWVSRFQRPQEASPVEIVSELVPFCKQRFLLSDISFWSWNVRTAVISSVSVGLIESCGFGSRGCGTIGDRRCSLSNRRRLSPGIARDFASIGDGRVGVAKVARRHLRKFGISSGT